MCGWSDNRLSAEEIRELNLIRMNIAKINKVIELKKNLGWPVADSEAQLMIALSLALSITAFSFCGELPKQEAAAADVQYTEEVCEDCTEPVKELGTFTTYAYCTCGQCCSEQNGITASGTVPEEGVTVAADPDVIPLGSHIVVAWDNGSFMREYTVEDTGSNIKGKTLDIYMESHEAALEFGVQELEVYLLEE